MRTTTAQHDSRRCKVTDIGLIPEDWDVKKLGDVGEIRMCRRVFNRETHEIGAIPFYKIGTFGKQADAHISQELYDSYRQKFSFPKKGDVLISAAGTIGRTIVYDGEPGYFQDSNIVWIDNNERLISNAYLRFVLTTIKYNTEGGTIQRLYNSIIRNATFACPSKSEQRAVATALSDVDSLIESLEKLIAKKRAIKQGAMQELLTGRRRLPRYSDPWITTSLGQIGTFSKGQGISKSEVESSGIACIRYGEIYTHHNDFIRAFYSFISKSTALKSTRMRKGDLLFTGSGETAEDIGKCVAYVGNDEAYAGGDIVILSPNGHDSKFLGYLMNSPIVATQKAGLGQGHTVVHITARHLARIELNLPGIEEQRSIAAVLSELDDEIEVLAATLNKYRNMKQAMMQVLLTGRIRLVRD